MRNLFASCALSVAQPLWPLWPIELSSQLERSFVKGGPFNLGYFCFLNIFGFFVASGFCGFWLSGLLWLLWLLAFVASMASMAFGFHGFCGFWLSWLLWLLWLLFFAYPSTCLYLSVYFISICLCLYLSFFLSFFLFGSCSPFSFCICFSFCLLCRDETKQASKQASKRELLTFGSGVLLGGRAAPPPNLHFIPDTRACHEINISR